MVNADLRIIDQRIYSRNVNRNRETFIYRGIKGTFSLRNIFYLFYSIGRSIFCNFKQYPFNRNRNVTKVFIELLKN